MPLEPKTRPARSKATPFPSHPSIRTTDGCYSTHNYRNDTTHPYRWLEQKNNPRPAFDRNSPDRLFVIFPPKRLLLLNFYKKKRVCVCIHPPQAVPHALWVLRKDEPR